MGGIDLKDTLIKQLVSSYNINNFEGDERQANEMNKIMSTGMFSLISFITLYFIIIETLEIRFKIVIPFELSEQMMFIMGMVCFICSVFVCRSGLLGGIPPVTLIIIGTLYPSFLLAHIPYVIFEGYEKTTSLITIILIPIFIITFYMILNYVYRKNRYRDE